ncbi:flippase-like domain-containing protein [Candidatus Saccharibacteria bacterium]|nr:flippase-like domain-containing protein [Candidatus Saccharibacteria bacterium]
MKFRSWLTIITFILLAVVVLFGWQEIVKAWNLLDKVNLWIWLLLIPVQLVSYYAVGEIVFSYLRSKGDLDSISRWSMTRTALELNFVNHVFPSGGAAGFSYLGWVLHRHGVSAGRATMAQIIRFVLAFVSFVGLVLLSLIALAFDHKVNGSIIAVSFLLVVMTVVGVGLVIFAISNHQRLVKFSTWLTRIVNKIVAKFRHKRKPILDEEIVEKFFTDLHQDYIELMHDKRVLASPFLWALFANICDVLLILLSFVSLGFYINPAIIFIAFGISSIMSFFSVTPGGTGVYEAVMIAFLASAGVSADLAIAGTLLARTTLLVVTIVFGYIFYQLTINKYGKTSR